MTFQQLQLIELIAQKGSVSSASQIMGLSQPNASQSLKKLEEEIGYPIFKRSEAGMIPTEAGADFIAHTQVILNEMSALKGSSIAENRLKLRVGVMNYTPAVQAFVRFCSENRDVSHADLTCINVNTESGIHMLKDRRLDLVVSLQLSRNLRQLERICRENMMEINKLGEIDICVRVRKDHPLILSGELDGSLQGFKKLKNYPYVQYLEYKNLLPTFIPAGGAPFGYSYSIYTDERENRLLLTANTNAYSIGAKISGKRLDELGLASVTIGKEQSTLVTISRRGEDKSSYVGRYIKLLREGISQQPEK